MAEMKDKFEPRSFSKILATSLLQFGRLTQTHSTYRMSFLLSISTVQSCKDEFIAAALFVDLWARLQQLMTELVGKSISDSHSGDLEVSFHRMVDLLLKMRELLIPSNAADERAEDLASHVQGLAMELIRLCVGTTGTA